MGVVNSSLSALQCRPFLSSIIDNVNNNNNNNNDNNNNNNNNLICTNLVDITMTIIKHSPNAKLHKTLLWQLVNLELVYFLSTCYLLVQSDSVALVVTYKFNMVTSWGPVNQLSSINSA